jgi:bifunctional non-homologous end joining protein LigD
MSLREYRRKRNFQATPEPRGDAAPARAKGLSYVIQKHAASRLHYDFRLEWDGVLKSWAVPKGPSLDPREKRLAVMTEDHPIEYGDFEGTIPEGEYGGGTVLLWDRGTWQPRDDPGEGLRQGKLVFSIQGQKLHGGWALVKLKGGNRAGGDWLLVKEKDEEARKGAAAEIASREPLSVASGRELEEVARDRGRTWASARRRRAASRATVPRVSRVARRPVPAASRATALPRTIEAQLATLVEAAPAGDEWLHEMKFDGYRILARLDAGRAQLWSRAGHDWTERFPELARALESLPVRRAWLDGEAAIVLEDGSTSFAALQNAGDLPEGARPVYFAFDLLFLDDADLRGVPLEERKRLLQELLPDRGETLRFSDHVVGDGPRFQAAACRMSLEGVVSKLRAGLYRPGRGTEWVKSKCLREQEVVIGGFTEPKGSREGIGALLVGVHDEEGALLYAGKVGTGFTAAVARDLRDRLSGLETDRRPFAPGRGVPRARFVEPRLVAQVRFTEWTRDGRMRHPAFAGLREDKEPGEVKRERPVVTPRAESRQRRRSAVGPVQRARPDGPVQVAGVRITHPERVVFADAGVTKEDLARYYDAVADVILPHLQDRPLTLVRCPEGSGGECFFVKHAGPWAPRSLRRVAIQEKTKRADYLVVDTREGLLGLAQMGVLEIHTWNAHARDLERPDRIVFDLDPGPGLDWAQMAGAAVRVRKRLEELDLVCAVKTSGGKGLHVVVPLVPRVGWEEALELSRLVSESLQREDPGLFVTDMAKSKREGRILIDYARNHRGSTSVAAWSTRARPHAPVSVPVAWEELPGLGGGDAFRLVDVAARLRRPDPWTEAARSRQGITASRLKKARGL